MSKAMRKRMICSVCAICLILVMAAPAFANTYSGRADWNVEFTPDKEMVSNFHTSDMDDTLRELQPGDDAYFKVTIKNTHPVTTHWYMTNKIIQSLEDNSYNSATAGGAYTYRLTYTNYKGEVQVLFDSDEVGGENISIAGEGLNEATSALRDFFFLDDLATGEGGVVELYVMLDGETQNNDYQDTLAELQLNFAVELEGEEIETSTEEERETTTTRREESVRTGDTNNPFIYYIMIGIAGVILLAAAIIRLVSARKKED